MSESIGVARPTCKTVDFFSAGYGACAIEARLVYLSSELSRTTKFRLPAAEILLGVVAFALVTLVGLWVALNLYDASLAYVIVIVLLCLRGSLIPALVLSIFAVGCLDHFFTNRVSACGSVLPADIMAAAAFATTSFVHRPGPLRSVHTTAAAACEIGGFRLRDGSKLLKRRPLGWPSPPSFSKSSGVVTAMRHLAWLAALFALSACGSSGSGQLATLILNNPSWDRVHVEAVVTKSPDCDNRDAYVSSQEFVMTKNRTQRIEAPRAENICWRHDRNPNNPIAGDWSGWSRATMFPGQTVETDL